MSNDSTKALNTAIVEGGLRRIPFFNGRVLTAEDLQTEGDANATERRRLGRGLGTGVLEGLFVRKSTDRTVLVEPGLGLAPSGRMVHLPKEVEVSVVSNIERDQTAGTGGDFEDCLTLETTVTSGTGAYVLFAEPASAPKGRTPRTTLGGDGVAGECGAKHRVEGASLRLVCLNPDDPDLLPDYIRGAIHKERDRYDEALDDPDEDPTPHASKLRNLWAHACLRTPSALAEPASFYDTLRDQSRGKAEPPEGPLDELRVQAREQPDRDPLDDAVPLGLFYWARDRIQFVDVWSVRRRVHGPDPQRPAHATAPRRAETEAAIYQFQDQVANLEQELSPAGMAAVFAEDHFAFLPPLGMLPEQAGEQPGFNLLSFFEGITVRNPVFIDGARLLPLLHRAGDYSSRRIEDEEFWWVYRIRQNRQGEFTDLDGGQDSAYLVFASGFLPYVGAAQFDLARWNYGNYGPAIDRTP